VADLTFGAFSEWGILSEKMALPVPTCAPQVVALLTSGLTASIGNPPPPLHLSAVVSINILKVVEFGPDKHKVEDLIPYTEVSFYPGLVGHAT
jgi:hypothetical protein